MTWSEIFSGEFWAAGFGATAAFALEAARQWRAERRQEQDAVNAAVMTIAQMVAHLKNIHEQAYVETGQRIRATHNREPLALEMLPLHIADLQIRLDLASLKFLARTHDPDVANRLAHAEGSFLAAVAHEATRGALHLECQRRLNAAGIRDQGVINPRNVIDAIGFDLHQQLESITAAQSEGLPRALQLLFTAQKDLVGVAKMHFPTRRFLHFHEVVKAGTTPVIIDRQADGVAWCGELRMSFAQSRDRDRP